MRFGNSINPRRHVRVGLVALLALGAVAAASVASHAATSPAQTGVSVPDSKLAAVQHAFPNNPSPESTVPATPPPVVRDTIPAQMLPPDCPIPISPEVVRVQNDWLVSDGVTLLAVYAGADGQDPSQGRVVIIRQDLQKGQQTQYVVDVPGSGALSIVNAPTGACVETSAQTGTLSFVGSAGIKGRLNLNDHTVTLNPSAP